VSGSPLRIGLIGAGRWGKIYIKALKQLEGFSLVRLASANPESHSLVHKDCHISEDWQDITYADDLDGVIIAAPPELHAEMTRASINASNPVLVEKPLTLDVAEARALLNDAEQQKAIVHVDHTHLYHPAFRALKNAGKASGPVQTIHGLAGGWGPFRKDLSVLWDRGSHDIAMCIDILGQKPDSVSVQIDESQSTKHGLGEAISVCLTFSGGAQANLVFSNLLKEKKRSFTVQYEEETLIYNDVSRVALSRQLKTGQVEVLTVLDVLPLDQVLIDFGAAIKKDRPDLDGLRLGVQVVEVLSDCQKFLGSLCPLAHRNMV
jgi:predicted dehydrogenase